MSTNEAVATFDNTHHALRFEKTLKENDIKLTVMPVPREISASCGLSVKFSMDEFEKVRNIAKTNEIQVKKYYEIIIENSKRGYLVLD
jgi:hypothetical protein